MPKKTKVTYLRKGGGRGNKFGAKKTVVDGITFASKFEADRYITLKYLQMAGEIKDLVLQPKFKIYNGFTDRYGKKRQPIYYIADFQYYEVEIGETVVEDTKGFDTDVFMMKKKMFLDQYPELDFRVVRKEGTSCQ